MEQINIKICRLIKDKLGKDVSGIQGDVSFRDDLEVDSLDFIEMVREVEKEFNIVIPDEAYEKLKTIGALNAYVAKHADPELVTVQELSAVEQD